MAFWSAWFKPTCPACEQKIDGEPVEYEDRKLCSDCYDKALEAAAVKRAEVEARRQAEEEARAKFEDRKTFGNDSR